MRKSIILSDILRVGETWSLILKGEEGLWLRTKIRCAGESQQQFNISTDQAVAAMGRESTVETVASR
jgi:hypothetical protein